MTNNQSKIEKLITELCPNGVALKELREILKRTKGTPITAKKMSEINKDGAPIKIFAGGKTVAYVNYSDIPDKDVLRKESVVVKSRGIIGFEYIDKPFSHKNEFWSYHGSNTDIIIKYVYYYLKNRESYFQSVGQKMSKMPQLSIPDTDKYKIPIPPPAIQQEIVKILDTFTALEAELAAELAAELKARKQQYEYYRDDLLTFGADVEWKTLGEACVSINAGGDLPDNYLKGQKVPSEEFPYPIYSNGTEEKALYGFTDCYKVDSEAVTISARGTIGYHTVRKAKFTPIVRLITLIAKTEVITSNFLNYILDVTEIGHSGGSIPQLTVPNVKTIKIPVPPLTEQERIVAILDKFDALVKDISVGLPAELNARRKQYEYYRNKLLTFEPLEEAHAKQ